MKDYVFTEKDNGGVHTNSGIPNKAAYNVIQAIGNLNQNKFTTEH